MLNNTYVVILAGGSGIRFWPLSTNEKPKQFLTITGEKSMIKLTVDRVKNIIPMEHILILTGKRYLNTTLSHLPDFPKENIIGEPLKKDTAAAVMLGASIIHHRAPESYMILLPADHIINPVEELISALKKAINVAKNGGLVTIGVKPTYPSESYGYLEKGEEIAANEINNYFVLKRFVEKPKKEIAQQYIKSGNFLWNSGMFIWKTKEILNQIRIHLPHLYETVMPLGKLKVKNEAWEEKVLKAYEKIQNTSIDFGVMEKAKLVYMIEAKFNWNDVGNWLSLKEFLDKDKKNNYTKSRCYIAESKGNIIICDDESYPIFCAGIKNTTIVISKNGALICNPEHTDKIKEFVERIQLENL